MSVRPSTTPTPSVQPSGRLHAVLAAGVAQRAAATGAKPSIAPRYTAAEREVMAAKEVEDELGAMNKTLKGYWTASEGGEKAVEKKYELGDDVYYQEKYGEHSTSPVTEEPGRNHSEVYGELGSLVRDMTMELTWSYKNDPRAGDLDRIFDRYRAMFKSLRERWAGKEPFDRSQLYDRIQFVKDLLASAKMWAKIVRRRQQQARVFTPSQKDMEMTRDSM